MTLRIRLFLLLSEEQLAHFQVVKIPIELNQCPFIEIHEIILFDSRNRLTDYCKYGLILIAYYTSYN